MFKNFKYTFALDILWFIMAGIIAYIILFSVQHKIDATYFYTLYFSLVVAIVYLKWIMYPTTSFFFNNIFAKILLLLLNLPFAYFILREFNLYIENIDDYSINFNPNISFPLASNLSVDSLLWIKNLTLISFISVLVMIVLMQFRIIWLLMRAARSKFSKDSGY